MGIIDRHLNVDNTSQVILSMNNMGITEIQNFLNYRNYYNDKPNLILLFIKKKFSEYISKNYQIITLQEADINFYLENICKFINTKFNNILNNLFLKNLIDLIEYNNSNNKFFSQIKMEYYKEIISTFFEGSYSLPKKIKKEKLFNIIDNNWLNIKFENIINLSVCLNKFKFENIDISKYSNIYENKFDDKINIVKLLEYINKCFVENKEDKDLEDIDNIKNISNSKILKKYNFRFIIDILKSNGFLLFEEYHKIITQKYKNINDFMVFKKEKRLINYFLYIISQKSSDNVNRYVNEKLIKIKDYLRDLEDNYNNNINYQKIPVKQESDKYKNIDLSCYNRDNTSFNIFKYTNTNKIMISKYNLCDKIEPYFDIYKSYYNSRYPDRELEFDIINSTTIVKVKFMEKTYYIHMAVIQFLVMDKLFKFDEGLNIIELSTNVGIKPQDLQDTINSLLKIKLIKRTDNKNIEEIKFLINYSFEYKKHQVSISSMVLKENIEDNKEKEFLHDRQTIVLANLYDYIKKNKYCYEDVLLTDLQYKIPFKLNIDYIQTAIKTAISKEHIKAVETQKQGCAIQIMYQLVI